MTALVGIVNLTPDSFSGDGIVDAGAALAHIDALIKDGAGVIDIGAESTRPGATALTDEEEWQRLAPIVTALGVRTQQVRFSIDTRHVANAVRAAAHGFAWINDVSGGEDPLMLDVVKQSGCDFVLMHSLGVPANPSRTLAAQADAVGEVLRWAQEKLRLAEKRGIPRAHIILDPGIGFGKTAEQSLALVRSAARFKELGVRLLIGHSRKSFLASLGGSRDEQTLALSRELIEQGVDFLRVHDVAAHAAMLRGRA